MTIPFPGVAERAKAEQPILAHEHVRACLRELEGDGGAWRDVCRNVRSHVIFIGYPRSGHSLVGALLDAHREMIVAHELDALRLMEQGLTREQIFWLEFVNSREFAAAGRTWGKYSYAVPGLWQGRFEALRVIGDKRGGASSKFLRQPGRLEKAREVLGPDLRMIHVARHPLDNISTIVLQHNLTTRADAIRYYFSLCESVADIVKRARPGELLQLYNDDFVADPRAQLAGVCRFLGVAPTDDYLAACASIVTPGVSRTREKVAWTDEELKRIRTESGRYEFLGRYEIGV